MRETITVLFLAASPKDRAPTSWATEHDRIQEAIDKGKYGHLFKSVCRFTAAPTDFGNLLTKHRPDVVHFCGHGDRQDGLIFQDARGFSQPIDNKALAEMFDPRNHSVRLVFLNACYSAKQAAVLSKTVDYVIGSKMAILDDRAIEFASRVYEALADGSLIDQAFRIGRLEISRPHLAQITVLKTKSGIMPQPLVYLPKESDPMQTQPYQPSQRAPHSDKRRSSKNMRRKMKMDAKILQNKIAGHSTRR
jgi:hypothetical protein